MKTNNFIINLRIRKIFVSLFKKICLKTKVIDKSAVFISHPDFCDNIYPLFKELQNRGFKCLWVLNYGESKNIAKKMGIKYIYDKKNMKNMLILSKYHYIFYSHSLPYMYDKPGQKIYNCWHGSPFKTYHGVLIDNNKENYYFVPSGEGAMNLYIKNYSDKICKKRCLTYRHFRTDYYLSDFQTEERRKVADYFKTDNYKKVVLVCLTWIRDKSVNETTNNLLGFPLTESDFDQLNERLKEENILLIIKPHPGQKVNNTFEYSNIFVISSFALTQNALQLYSLIGISDVLITDYSSILFDYALLSKPVGHIIHHWDYFVNNKHEEFIYKNPEEIMYGTKIRSLEQFTEFIVSPTLNDEEKRQRINREYNSDPYLLESSTLRFIKDELHC